MHLLPAIIFVAVGALVVVLARSVREGNVELLAGYDATRVTNKTGLAAWAGGNLLMLGYGQMLAGLLTCIHIETGAVLFFFSTLILVARTALGSLRFYR
ncbi:hypothetical protein [Hymenobacter crusticola]|uniref:DUF3784 domain-containing protein n=1 Tax=Hymenobacter crusticola TaxID=1770526 RepID=A0A243WDS7_9BACT|nr:hypothetical protein [Hymenobacter crusticola]OUJ73253.1 hypothetical protein BXP70_15635 [Hymenobacter crusticola]